MIAFASLFLGLILGVEPVEILVGDPVAAVEILLDGRSLGTLQGPPWVMDCDFGAELAPHELVAVAYDAGHEEVGRARQWVNLPHGLADAAVVLEGGTDGRGVVARLTWDSVVGGRPQQVTATFDGRRLDVDDPHSIRLPDHDPRQLHFLRVELDFSASVSSSLEMVFGGSYADRVSIEMTAVAVAVDRPRKLDGVADLRGRFQARGSPLEVVAVEKGPAEVLVVRDEAVRPVLSRAGRAKDAQSRWDRTHFGTLGPSEALRYRFTLDRDDRIRLLWPFAVRPEAARTLDVFSPSSSFSSEDGGFFWLLTEVPPPFLPVEEQRLADAVGVAGLLAASRDRRRAVVLVIGPEVRDTSVLEPALVRGYLHELTVPLVVWSPFEPTEEIRRAWGDVVDVSTLRKLEKAFDRLHALLESQRIVWLDGVHLPQDVTVQGPGLRLAP